MCSAPVDMRYVSELQIIDMIVCVLTTRVRVTVASTTPSMAVRHHEAAILGAGAIPTGFLARITA